MFYKFFIQLLLTALCFFAFSNKASAQFSDGNGTENNPYIITTAQQLAQLATYVNAGNTDYNDKCYKLGNDISLVAYQSGTGWTPIGRSAYEFCGNFDGNSKIISGLVINNDNLDYTGLFGCTWNATVKNLAVVNVNIRGDWFVGGVAGSFLGGNIENCYSTGNVNGSNRVGGVAGQMKDGSTVSVLRNCYFSGKVNGNYAGGVVGYTEYGHISQSYSAGEVNGGDYVGGVVGYISYSSVFNCYSISEVSGNNRVGGIASTVYFHYTTKVQSCVALNPNVKGTYLVGRVAGDHGFLYENVAWNGILNINGNSTWNNKGEEESDGADITLQSILADGTLGGRFTAANGWTTQNGKLPGLFGKPVDMPGHLGGTGIDELQVTSSELRVYPNPVTNELQVMSYELQGNIEIFDIMGRALNNCQFSIVNPQLIINVSSLPSGIYFLRVGERMAKFVKK